jgi:outer membrane protein assembly factor BamB
MKSRTSVRILGIISILVAVVATLSMVAQLIGPAPVQARRSPQPPMLDTSAPLLLIHGYSLNSAVDCQSYGWGATETYLRAGHTVNGQVNVHWTGPTYTIGYYQQDTHCDINLNTSTDPASQLGKSKCATYPQDGITTGNNSDPIEHLACELAWVIYYDFQSPGTLCPGGSPPCAVDIVDHSMGGLIARWAIAEVLAPVAPFPPSLLDVHDVVDFDVPNNGANLAHLCPDLSICPEEGKEMDPGSTFLTTLQSFGGYPQGLNGTHWTMMGAAADVKSCLLGQIVGASSSTDMQNGTKIWYQKPCYDHAYPGVQGGLSMMADLSDSFNAQVLFCLSCGASDPKLASDAYPHTLLAMLYGLTDQPILPRPLPPPPEVSTWPMLGYNPQRTGLNPNETFLKTTNVSHLTLDWSANTGGDISGGSPAVVNGIAYIGSAGLDAYNVYTHALLWSFTTSGSFRASPAVVNGVVYAGSNDGNLYALNATTGAVKWQFTTGNEVQSSPTVVGGIVYFGSVDDNVYAVDATTGKLKWKFATGGMVFDSPAVASGTVYITSEDGNLYALNSTTGAVQWSKDFGGGSSSPSVSNGVVYIASCGIYALDATTGAEIWNFPFPSSICGGSESPSVANGIVYMGNYDDTLYAVDITTGLLKWSFTTGDVINSQVAIANGVVYLPSADAHLYALDATSGALLWTGATGGALDSPAVVHGVVYSGSEDSNLYAFHLPGTTP